MRHNAQLGAMLSCLLPHNAEPEGAQPQVAIPRYIGHTCRTPKDQAHDVLSCAGWLRQGAISAAGTEPYPSTALTAAADFESASLSWEASGRLP